MLHFPQVATFDFTHRLLQTKSMAHHLFLTSNLDAPRRQRFPDRFVDDIAALVCAISADIAGRYHKVHNPQIYSTSKNCLSCSLTVESVFIFNNHYNN